MTLKLTKSSFCNLVLGIGALFLSTGAGRADFIYASFQASSIVLQFDSAGNRSDFLSADNGSGLAFDSSGNAYVGATGFNIVTKYDSFGQGTVFASGLHEPHGLAFDAHDNLYVADVTTVRKFAPDGTGSIFAAGFNGAVAVAIDRSNNVFVASFYDKNVQKFDASGNRTIFASGLDSPVCLALDHSGNLYVGNEFSNTILKFDPQGNGVLFANSLVAQPLGLAVDTQGNLYVANAGPRTIAKFDPFGHGTIFASSLPLGLRSVVALPSAAPHDCLLACPTNMLVCVEPGEHGAIVNFSAAFATSCLGFAISCAPPSGSFFPMGKHKVICSATDQVGHISQACTFEILVHPCRRNP